MAKANVIISGNSTYGAKWEAARRATDGAWFQREYVWNGYGKGWSKWMFADYESAAMFDEEIASCEVNEEGYGRIAIGFNTQSVFTAKEDMTIRLPNLPAAS